MRRSLINRFARSESAAIGPLYALGISTLVVMSAIGFDYGRLMALDSELQNAADQAALAAATQLDGGDDAMTRARDAANNTFANSGSSFVNETRFANDGQGRPITSLTFEFFDGYADDTPGSLLTSDDDGADAKVVQVTVNARQVFYALTPLVGAINSGDVIGKAMAGLQSATCNVPPLMFCVPNTGAGSADTGFPRDSDVGRGLHLHMNSNAADPWAPGNFGFLNIDYGPAPGNPNHTLGLNSDYNGCSSDVIESETGVRDPQSDALNSRFDMYNASVGRNSCDADGNFCPAENVRRNWVNIQTRNNVVAAQVASQTCSSTPSNNWVKVEDLPTVPGSGDLLVNPGYQQMPKDDCLLSGSCGAVLGDGVWAGDAYMAKFHPGTSLSTAAPNGTRWEVYNWEIANKATNLSSPSKVGYYADRRSGGGAPRYNVDLYCAFPQPVIGTALPPSETQKDRRLLTVAAVDCTGLHGSQPVKILRWVDLFLVQPTPTTGSDKSFFTEIVGPAKQANGDSGFQYFGRKKAVLIR